MKFRISSQSILESVSPGSMSEIKAKLTMDNPKYDNLEKMGRWTGDTPDRLYFYEEFGNILTIPRGSSNMAWRILSKNGDEPQLIDERILLPEIQFQFKGQLRQFQHDAVNEMLKCSHGVLSSGTGSGKTVMGIYIIAERKQPTLVIVHNKELVTQWIERIESFLGIPSQDVGVIGAGKSIIADITVATVQTLCKDPEQYADKFGHVVVDECHKTPS
ncbi:MAG: DEAD/DEAH box helicase family protein, partial [Desulfamplus sp.]|nr:DEAD/DEAH box helicase family protein [Desulfamplus sp.]